MPKRIHSAPAALCVSLGVMSCGPSAPAVGTPRSATVAEARFEVRANGTDLVRTRVVFPATPRGEPRGASHPAVVFIQGGRVDESRYLWLAERLAEADYVVALPHHGFDLAFFSADNGRAARALLDDGPGLLAGLVDPDRVAVAGHSLGGVVAAGLAAKGGFRALVLHASYPNGPDAPALNQRALQILALAGSNDCSAKLETVRTSLERLSPPAQLEVLDGVTHYQFTDSDAEDVKAGCARGVELDAAHALIAGHTRAFLDRALR